MIIGGSKKEVINNIKTNTINNELNKKVEIGDPSLTEEETDRIINNFFKIRKHKIMFSLSSFFAYAFVDILARKINKSIEIEGLEHLKNINRGIVTSNHFNQMDTMIVRKAIRKYVKKNIYIVSQETNLALPGFFGYLVNHLNIIPICKGPNYINNIFRPYLKNILDKNNFVLIYPEEEMWFNYRKPRPCKRGAYQFACENNVPIISCFTEIIDGTEDDNEEFKCVKYIIHILKPIYPDENKTVKENAKIMADLDYKQKCEAYEKAYHKKLDYKFSKTDIAGYKG